VYWLVTYVELVSRGTDAGPGYHSTTVTRAPAFGFRDAFGSRARALKGKVSRTLHLPRLQQ
jgi:hypothetical protein